MRIRSSFWTAARSQAVGTHDELLAANTIYQEIYNQQNEQRAARNNGKTCRCADPAAAEDMMAGGKRSKNPKKTLGRLMKYIQRGLRRTVCASY